MSQDQILLTMFSPGKTVRKISVSGFATIKDLGLLYGNPNTIFIYKGQILSKSQTFNYYKMQNGDSIISLFPNQEKLQRWQDLSTLNNFNALVSLEAAQEHTKCMDLRLSKMDLHPRKYRLLCKRVKSFQEHSNIHENLTTVLPRRTGTSQPNSEPLPIFWSQTTPHVSNNIMRQNSISQLIESENPDQNILMK